MNSREILLNLLGNAVKYTPSGGVTFSVSYDADTTNVLRCGVQDTGCGIASEDLETIFAPFAQVGESSHFIEGTGLGLYVCDNLAQSLRGRIEVESEPGNGSTFRIILPDKERRAVKRSKSEK